MGIISHSTAIKGILNLILDFFPTPLDTPVTVHVLNSLFTFKKLPKSYTIC